ncbi:MAG: hypothetical protein ACD_75C00402G0002 [uncultured bacterium]|nr:MAG: hypothetical protein ACD_75C00402G0002 [uncultured bacterium]
MRTKDLARPSRKGNSTMAPFMKIPLAMTIAPEAVGEETFLRKRTLIARNRTARRAKRTISRDTEIDPVAATQRTAVMQAARVAMPFGCLISMIIFVVAIYCTEQIDRVSKPSYITPSE